MTTDARVPCLDAFAGGPGVLPDVVLSALRDTTERGLVYDGPGWIGGALRRSRCVRTSSGFRLEVVGASTVEVGEAGDLVLRRPGSGTVFQGLDLEVLFGPALVLALALRGIFALHAGGVLRCGSVAAFVGPSGAGKSTLAGGLSGGPGRDRVSDDVLPISGGSPGAFALPQFPQMKLPREEQYGADRPEKVPLSAVYVIATAGAQGSGESGISIRPMGLRESVLALLSYTVASRLFDAGLTERHMAFCEDAARRVSVRELVYERRLDLLPAVRAAVEADLASVAPGRDVPTG